MKNFARTLILALALAGFTELSAQNAKHQIVAPQNHKAKIAVQEGVKTKNHASKNSAAKEFEAKNSTSESAAKHAASNSSPKAATQSSGSKNSTSKNFKNSSALKNSTIEISNLESSKTEKSAPKNSKAKSLKAKNSVARSRKSAVKNSAKSVPLRSAQKSDERALPPLRLEVSERAYYEDGAWKLSDPAPSSAGTEQARHPGRGFSFSPEFGSDAPRYKWQQKDGAGGGKSRSESALDILQNKMDTIKLDVEFRH